VSGLFAFESHDAPASILKLKVSTSRKLSSELRARQFWAQRGSRLSQQEHSRSEAAVKGDRRESPSAG